jgi:hypothetical protein
MKTLALIALSGLAATAANAQTFSFLGTPGSIPDNAPAGLTLNTGAVAGANATISTVSVSIDFSTATGAPGHTWIGDLIATLTYTPSVGAPVSFSLMNRVGRVTTGFGDSSNITGIYTFANGGGDLWAAAGLVGDAVAVATGTYAATGANAATALDMDAAFAGLSSTGTWSLVVVDAAGGDTGAVASASVTIGTIPTPGAAALLGLGGLAAFRRRRA